MVDVTVDKKLPHGWHLHPFLSPGKVLQPLGKRPEVLLPKDWISKQEMSQSLEELREEST